MDLKQFYSFIAIAEECNLSRAAERLYTSQPSLSRFISKLEQSLNVQLFVRKKNNSLVITEPGERLLDYCRRVVVEYESYTNYLSDFNLSTRQIFCGVASDRGSQLMTAVFSKFAKLYPDIKIKLLQLSSDKLIEHIRNGTLDIARCAYYKADPMLSYTHLVCQRVDLIVPLNHPLASRGSKIASDSTPTISLNEIKNESIVLLNNTTVLRQVVQEYLEKNKVFPKIDIEVATSSSALTIVENGLAIGLLPRAYSSEKVRFLQLDPPLYYNTGLIYRKENSLPQWKKDLIRLCQEEHVPPNKETITAE